MSLKSIFLPKLKDTDEDRKNKNLVYSIPCKDCDTVYIGETGRMKETRINERKVQHQEIIIRLENRRTYPRIQA